MFSQIAATQLVQGLREGHDWRYAAADMIEEMQKIIHDYVMRDERQKALDRKADNARELGLNYEPEQEPVAWMEDSIELYVSDHLTHTHTIPLYTSPPRKEWVGLTDEEITGAAHDKAIYPVSILETTKSGLCLKFSESGEWHCSDKFGDYMIVDNFLMSFAKAIEAKLKEKNT